MRSAAFSLIELSIVLVILGLLTGGILAGQSLIRAAELRSISTDLGRFQTALGSFRDKYFALPGDMNNATKFWGTDTGSCPGTYTDATLTDATCDGNGDGQILTNSGSQEIYRAWQHLDAAGLIEGSYTGLTISSSIEQTPGVNTPRGRISNTGYHISFVADQATGTWFAGSYGNVIRYGAVSTSVAHNSMLRPEEMWNIDTKMDDGKPATGVIRTYTSTSRPNCNDGTTTSANYLLSYNGTDACNVVFITKY